VRSKMLFAIVAWSFFFSSAAYCQSVQSCDATKDHPVQICFEEPPLVVDHCKREIELHFHVGLLPFDNGIQPSYYFTYQVFRNGKPDALQDPLNGKLLLTRPDPFSQIPDAVHIAYLGAANVSVTLNVYADGREPVTLTSQIVPLNDPILVTAVIVGISAYTSQSMPQLIHSDEDASSFHTFLKTIFPDNLVSTLLTSDANDSSKLPTVDNILGAINSERLKPHSCSNDDWFIFYFSGHGVVGSNEAAVGNSGAVATHYLSTTLLDPGNLSATAIPIEEVMNRIRSLAAGNKVVILDSCFSGSSKRFHPLATDRSTPVQGTHSRSYKVAYIYHKAVVDPYEFQARNPNRGSGDLLAFKEVSEKEEADSKRGLYLAAAFADHEAEEGLEKHSETGLDFTPSDFEKDDEKPMGHGLYTFALLWNLLTQLPKNSVLPEILKGQKPKPMTAGDCSIDFLSAHDVGTGEIVKLQQDSRKAGQPRDYQKPDVAGHTQTALPELPCRVPIQNESVPGQNESPH
jgi:hypothetical protein